MEADGIAADHDARPDGIHLGPDAALAVAEQWLGPQLVIAATENALAQLAASAASAGPPATTGLDTARHD
jgi:thiamine monophosphate synthase